MRLLSVLCLLATICSVNSYKILFYSNLFGHSHVKMLAAAADTLTDAGHNVTVLIPVFDTTLNTSLKTTKNVIFVDANDQVEEFVKARTSMLSNMWKQDAANPITLLQRVGKMAEIFSSQCKKVLTDTELIEKMKAENYDLAVTEPFDSCAYRKLGFGFSVSSLLFEPKRFFLFSITTCIRLFRETILLICFFNLSHILHFPAFFEAINIRAHVAVLSSSRLDHVSDVIGQPAAPSYNPGLLSANGDKMTMLQRFVNVIQYMCGSYFFSYVGDVEAAMAKEINPTWRTWRETVPEASFILTNQIPLLDFPAPTFDKIVPVGGLSVITDKKAMKLPEKWDKILSLRKNNVFISFGSNARSLDMPLEYKNSLLQVIRNMPDTSFIWKYEDLTDKFTEGVENVYLGDWLPQNELLADPRLNVFITHGGLGSVTELSMMGTPAVMIPLFADQSRNAQMLKRHGGAAVLTKTDLANTKLVQDTIQDVLANPKYRENAERLAEMLNNQPTNPKETLVKYVEFAARFGKLPSLDNYGRHQSFVQYFFLDIIAIIALISVTSSYISYRVLKCAVRRCFGSRCSEAKSKKE
ncbi:LOW QUALITY PROTEIN: Protein CBR-UGT-19 [Caenorhabditis briggsae]|uniref:glucuronosyltransferase n=1 Tax=Caenorhabditis briggsae TaxID=6238 RepID=A8X031_CAEBR|nr:LOW QUALITY PROTEIN: Protein CBR-UGT-19 [Caenorhabditis briggsae]CAP25991.1 Protein CBR-UGT-19 [Caenorhabditis briggsae]